MVKHISKAEATQESSEPRAVESPRPMHTVGSFDDQLNGLNEKIIRMAETACLTYEKAAVAFTNNDVGAAKNLLKKELRFQNNRNSIEELCVHTLARYQPMGDDLRFVVSCINIASNLENIGDNLAGICRLITRMQRPPANKLRESLGSLSGAVQSSLKQLCALTREPSADLALELYQHDEQVDASYAEVYQLIADVLRASHKKIPDVMNALFMATYTERIGDQCADLGRLYHHQFAGAKIGL